MRCSVKGCNITCKYPRKSMCWRDFSMCKYHACELHPEAYTTYRATSDDWTETIRKLQYG